MALNILLYCVKTVVVFLNRKFCHFYGIESILLRRCRARYKLNFDIGTVVASNGPYASFISLVIRILLVWYSPCLGYDYSTAWFLIQLLKRISLLESFKYFNTMYINSRDSPQKLFSSGFTKHVIGRKFKIKLITSK